VRDGVSEAAVRLYAAREVEPLDLEQLTGGEYSLDGIILVIKGDEETFNEGLSGTTNVVANHRIFDGGYVLHQIVEFSDTGEPFSTPIWWRWDVHSASLFRENPNYSDYLRPVTRNRFAN
jgi:hypothetical protein